MRRDISGQVRCRICLATNLEVRGGVLEERLFPGGALRDWYRVITLPTYTMRLQTGAYLV